jgi:2-iminobutanoate/2-iminopropanoate deaminase
MQKKEIISNRAPKPVGPYSQAIRVDSLVFVSGQIPIDLKTGNILETNISEQAELILKNIESILKQAGLNMDNVVKTTIYLKNIADFQFVNTVYQKFFKPPYPARSCIEVSGIPKGALLEIEAVAYEG